MVYSALVFRDVPPVPQPARATVITLHGNQGSLDDLVPMASDLGSGLRIVAPQAARGVHDSKHFVVGHSWYASVSPDKPEPASFGDSLAQIERFVIDVQGRAEPGESPRLWLLGYREGAVMSLAAAGVLPDLFSGVIAICGSLPTLRDWHALVGDADGLPILLVSDPDDPLIPLEIVRQTHDALMDWGASVTIVEVPGARDLGPDVSTASRNWLASAMAGQRVGLTT